MFVCVHIFFTGPTQSFLGSYLGLSLLGEEQLEIQFYWYLEKATNLESDSTFVYLITDLLD